MLIDSIDLTERNVTRVIHFYGQTLYFCILSLMTLYAYSKISDSVLIGLSTALLVTTFLVCCELYARVVHLERRFIEDEIM